MRLLVVNAGSSSLKLTLLDSADRLLAGHEFEANGGRVERSQLDAVISGFEGIEAVGHRFVHGGERFHGPTLVGAEAEAYLRSLTELAPLHQPPALEGLDAMRELLPGVAQVACFDTAFHAGLPPAALTYPLPEQLRRDYGLRRYGFHGLSHAYASRRAAELLGKPLPDLAIVTCHLGSGCSLAAVLGGRSVDTTMGFTPLEGVVMATRSGSIDPGMLLWLQTRQGLTAERLEQALEHESGLQGLAGTGDMRNVLAAADAGDERARLALDVYAHRLRAGIAAMAAAMGRLDVLVFTGGVGQNAPRVREDACGGLAFLGVNLSRDMNRAVSGDADVSEPASPVRTMVIEAREDLEIARQVREVLG